MISDKFPSLGGCTTLVADFSGLSDLPIEDASALASSFATLMNATHIRLRFEVINTNTCRKFHIDGVNARLVCT